MVRVSDFGTVKRKKCMNIFEDSGDESDELCVPDQDAVATTPRRTKRAKTVASSSTKTASKKGRRSTRRADRALIRLDTISSGSDVESDESDVLTDGLQARSSSSSPTKRVNVAAAAIGMDDKKKKKWEAKQSEAMASPHHIALTALSPDGVPDSIVGRESERKELVSFLQRTLMRSNAGSMYISGKPGTGKTALVRELTSSKSAIVPPKTPVVHINCMAVKQPKAFFQSVWANLTDRQPPKDDDELQAALLNVFSRRSVVLVADEVDQLMTRSRDVLYTLFQWPHQPDSKLVVIGIANALDLTERVLPFLRRHECQPDTMQFHPYTRVQLVEIMKQRLANADAIAAETATKDAKLPSQLLHLPAVQLCAAKVTAVSGDIRQALELCRRTLQLMKTHPGKPAIMVMSSLFDVVLGSDLQRRISRLPLHQSLLMLSMCRLGACDGEVALASLSRTYVALCKQMRTNPEPGENIGSLVDGLACSGLVSVSASKRRDAKSKKVKLLVLQKDVEDAYKANPALAPLLATAPAQ